MSTTQLLVAGASSLTIVASWLAIKWQAASRHYRQILCAPIDTSAEDEQ
jgi:uncharacterized membrane protein YozB (DUF420 family)